MANVRAIPASFDNIRLFCFGLIIAVFSAATQFGDFFPVMKTFPSDPAGRTLLVLKWILFLELIVLAFRWVIATDCELKHWWRYLDHPEQSDGRRHVVKAMLALSFALGVMLAMPHNIILITGFVSVSYVLNCWTQRLADTHFVSALEHTRAKEAKELARDEPWREVLDVLAQYWTKRPQIGRIYAMMFWGIVAFALAIASRVDGTSHRQTLEISAYVVLSVDLLVGEIVVGRWRFQRESQIVAIAARAQLSSRVHAHEI